MASDPGAAAVRLPARQNLADDVYEALKAMIMDHVMAPGARVNVYALSRELGVSQTPLRKGWHTWRPTGSW